MTIPGHMDVTDPDALTSGLLFLLDHAAVTSFDAKCFNMFVPGFLILCSDVGSLCFNYITNV
jgi:hypothetical protein